VAEGLQGIDDCGNLCTHLYVAPPASLADSFLELLKVSYNFGTIFYLLLPIHYNHV
jgi:hypothetical protein